MELLIYTGNEKQLKRVCELQQRVLDLQKWDNNLALFH